VARGIAREARYTVERYLGLLHDGVLSPDDRVELLEGVIVAEPPSDPPHATAVCLAAAALDRLSKSAIYAGGDIPEYWIVNLRNRTVEVFREPDSGAARYAQTTTATVGTRLELVALPGVAVLVDDLLPDVGT